MNIDDCLSTPCRNGMLISQPKKSFSFKSIFVKLLLSYQLEMIHGCSLICPRILDYVIELRHKIYLNNLNIGMALEIKPARAPKVV